jgi:hypothetical protein
MEGSDEWGRDPGVRFMRRVFAEMETASRALLEASGIPRLEPRLRGWRERALGLFEHAWVEAAGRGLEMSAERAAAIYAACLARIMISEGVVLGKRDFSGDREVEDLLKEVLP